MSLWLQRSALALALAALPAPVGWAQDAPAKPADQKEPAEQEQAKPEQTKPDAESKQATKADAKPEAQKPDPKPAAQKPKPKAPETYTVKKDRLRVELKLTGVFEPERAAPIVVRPQAWTELVVIEAKNQGQGVKKGEVLVNFDTEKIDRLIESREQTLAAADLELKLAREQLAFMEKSVPIDLAAYERANRMAQEDLKRYLQINRKYREKSANQNLRTAKNYLAYVQEELNQLEKMYSADDLTEETEEIILKRARDQVERYEFTVEGQQLSHEEATEIDLPRLDESMKQAAKVQQLRLNTARQTLPTQLKQQRLTVEKMERERDLAEEYLDRLKSDRQNMVVKAPADGVLYYGAFVNGRWKLDNTLPQRLEPAGVIKPNEVFMTLVMPGRLFVRATVKEEQVRLIKPDVPGHVIPKARPDLPMKAKVVGVTPVPTSPGEFDARVAMDLPKGSGIWPGMTCEINLVPVDNKDALVLPAAAVFTEQDDPATHYVHLLRDDGKHEKRTVQTGETVDSKTQITDGLKAGDKVLKKKPS